jgi:hypothetical protein
MFPGVLRSLRSGLLLLAATALQAQGGQQLPLRPAILTAAQRTWAGKSPALRSERGKPRYLGTRDVRIGQDRAFNPGPSSLPKQEARAQSPTLSTGSLLWRGHQTEFSFSF